MSELPETRHTLLVRLLGAGRVLRRAIRELQALPDDAPERQIAIPAILGVRLTIAEQEGLRSEEEQELVMATADVYEAWRQRVHFEGLERGLEQGRVQGLEQGLAAGALRGLRSAVLSAFEARFGAPPAELSAALEATNDETALGRWLTAVVTLPREELLRRVAGAAP